MNEEWKVCRIYKEEFERWTIFLTGWAAGYNRAIHEYNLRSSHEWNVDGVTRTLARHRLFLQEKMRVIEFGSSDPDSPLIRSYNDYRELYRFDIDGYVRKAGT